MQETEILPLFPLGLVLFPGMVLPLHIFEEQNKLMISECIKQEKNFGIVYYNGDTLYEAGCSAEVIKVIQKYNDGRMDILTQGIQRFYIEDASDAKPYLEAKVKYFDDEYETDPEGLEIITVKGIELLNELVRISTDQKAFPDIKDLEPKVLSFLIASNPGFSFGEKQAFLEIINTRERIEKGVKSLQKIMERLIITKDIEKIIQGNGYLPHKR